VPTRKVERTRNFCTPRMYTDFSVSMFVGDFCDHFCALTPRTGPECTRIFLSPCLSVIFVTISALSRATHAQKHGPEKAQKHRPEKHRLKAHLMPFLNHGAWTTVDPAARSQRARLPVRLAKGRQEKKNRGGGGERANAHTYFLATHDTLRAN
jgi:hypothetical protein